MNDGKLRIISEIRLCYFIPGIQQLVSILSEDDKVIVSLVCDVLSSLAKHSNVRVAANKINIIEKLVIYCCIVFDLKLCSLIYFVL